jgi:DNA-binding HxlR family transcriptional regulator
MALSGNNHSVRRTSELKRSIPGITERMLIRHLQELVADGIVKRR